VNTLAHYASLHPTDELYLLLGADVLESFGQWREPGRILQLARVVLLERQRTDPVPLPEDLDWANVLRLPTRRVDVSSTEIRERVRLDKPIRGFVTDEVAAYIARAGLYR
jgi:nicotinate-nucleotide adenylyltransferase